MIALIVKSYLNILLLIGGVTATLFCFGLYFILRKSKKPAKIEKPQTASAIHHHDDNHHVHDLAAIAGDDLMATQLDLARAYIETGHSHLAKNILQSVVKDGAVHQQQEATRLLSAI